MEERHGEVADVFGCQRVHLGHNGPDAGQPALAAQAGLGRAGGTRGEEEVAERLWGHRSIGHLLGVGRRVRLERALRLVGVEHQHTLVGMAHLAQCIADAGTFHQGQVGGVGDQELAFGVGQVARQLVAAVRGVGAHHHGADQRGRLEPEDELWDVVEQEGDVEGAVQAAGLQPGRPGRRPGHHLGVGEAELAGHQAEPVVVGQGQHGTGDGLVVGAGMAPPPAVRPQLGSLHLRTSLTRGGSPITGTRCILIRPVLRSLERRRNGPRHRRRGRATHGIRHLQRRVPAAPVRRAARGIGRARPHHGRGRLHRGGRQGRLQVHLGVGAPLPHRVLAPVGLRVLPGLLAAKTSHIHIGSGIFNITPPVNHPARIAERVAMLDHLTEGRFEFGTGRGSSTTEQKGFGINDSELTREMVAETLPQIVRMWRDEDYSYDGKFFSMPSRNVLPKPYSKPHPAIWMAAGSPSTFDLAAELGVGVLCFGFSTPDQLTPLVARYKEKIGDCTNPVGGFVNNNIMITTPMICMEDGDKARQTFLEASRTSTSAWSSATSTPSPSPRACPNGQSSCRPWTPTCSTPPSPWVPSPWAPRRGRQVDGALRLDRGRPVAFGMLSTSMPIEACEEAVETFGKHVLPSSTRTRFSTTRQRLAAGGSWSYRTEFAGRPAPVDLLGDEFRRPRADVDQVSLGHALGLELGPQVLDHGGVGQRAGVARLARRPAPAAAPRRPAPAAPRSAAAPPP